MTNVMTDVGLSPQSFSWMVRF